jgi:hypothetical protein
MCSSLTPVERSSVAEETSSVARLRIFVLGRRKVDIVGSLPSSQESSMNPRLQAWAINLGLNNSLWDSSRGVFLNIRIWYKIGSTSSWTHFETRQRYAAVARSRVAAMRSMIITSSVGSAA